MRAVRVSWTLPAGVVALGAFKIAALAASGPVGVLSTALAALALAVPAALKAIEDARTKNAFKNVVAADFEAEKVIEAAKEQAQEKLNAAKAADAQIIKSGLDRIREINKQYIKDTNDAKSLNAALVADAERRRRRAVTRACARKPLCIPCRRNPLGFPRFPASVTLDA